jgi:predicted O-linked N-acetylglucosamine transferase (SPINDLY family)
VQKASEVHSPPKAREAARLEHGLPPSNFLIANFNNLDKLEPRMWHLWCDLIRRYRRAALWLQKYPPARASRVQDMAKEEGKMDMARLVMTPFFKSDHHIGIKALADVFVDNPTYNAHSTAMDTLWGALPFVTLAEEKMAARVGASLLMALDSRWGVVRNLADMAAVVEALMTHPHTLRRLRQSMEEARHTAALFDTVRAVRNLEVALRLMWEAHAAAAAGLRGRPRPHIISRDVGPKSAGRGVAGQAGGAGDDALEARLFGMRVDTSKAEQTSGV